eukprot:gene9759-20294_t
MSFQDSNLSEISLSDSDARDEVAQIKHAMKVAKARQAAIGAGNRADLFELQQLKTICDDQSTEIINLKQQLTDKDLELRECKYEWKMLKDEIKSINNAKRLEDRKGVTAITTLKTTLEAVEKAVNEQQRTLINESSRILRLVAGLEKHTLHGLHIVASRTAVGLLLKIRQGVEGMLTSFVSKSIMKESIENKKNQQ